MGPPPPESQPQPDSRKTGFENLDKEEAEKVGHGYCFWFFVVFCADVLSAILGVMLWSMMGAGADSMVFLAKMESVAYPIAFVAFILIVCLYLLDFYHPPHLEPQRLALGAEGSTANKLGRIVFGFAVSLLVISVCFMIKDYPHIPPLLTAFLGPVLVAILRKNLGPGRGSENGRETAKRILRNSVIKTNATKQDDSNKRASLCIVNAIQATASNRMEDMRNEASTKASREEEKANAERYSIATMDLLLLDKETICTKVDPEKIRQQLRERRGRSEDARRFYGAAAPAVLLVSVIVSIMWIIWWLGAGNRWNPTTRGKLEDKGIDDENFSDDVAKSVMYIVWVSPLITAATHGIFGVMIFLRWRMHDKYVKTDRFEMAVQRILEDTSGDVHQEHYDILEQAKSLNKQITSQVRILISVAVGLFGCIWIASEVAAADVEASRVVKGFVGFWIIAMVFFLTHSFQHWWREMGALVKTSPLYQGLQSFMRSDWIKALLVYMIGPFWPFFLMLSALNQKVRRCRGLHDSKNWPSKPQVGDGENYRLTTVTTTEKSLENEGEAPFNGCLTARVAATVTETRLWDWTSVYTKVHWWGVIYFSLNVGSAKGLNIFLSWLNSILSKLPLAALVLIFYVVGIFCFLMPPVPGPPVYLFGGLLFASNPSLGFEVGTLLCIFVSWCLKLNACAMQQKCIGERLGESQWVLSTCGVNKPFMKAVEIVLKERGLTAGKCAILCGGPDWPTSVTCGLLRVPLHQAILGTFPIIFFVIPCVCTGAFFTQQGDIWVTASSLMLTASTGVGLVLYALATFAIQGKMEKYHEHLHRPLVHHIELDWLDHVGAECAKLARENLVWERFPGAVRLWHRTSALMMLLSTHIFYWFDASCFGDFTIQTPISELDADYVKAPMGVAGLILFFTSCFSLYLFKKYCSRSVSKPIKELQSTLAIHHEQKWKEKRKAEAIQADKELRKNPELLPPHIVEETQDPKTKLDKE